MLDPEPLTRAVADADLVVLVAAIVHLTGDATLLDRFDVDAYDHGRRPATLSERDAQEIRTLAVEVLTTVDLDANDLTERPPVEALLHRIMNFCAGEEIDAGYVALALEESNFDGRDRRRFVWGEAPTAEARERLHVAIIGAGLGGVCAAIRLEQAGIPYTVFDKNPDVGGTWFENTYPDLRVDVPNHFYSYSFAPNPDWSDYFARREELAAYIECCAVEYGIVSHIRFDAEVVAAD